MSFSAFATACCFVDVSATGCSCEGSDGEEAAFLGDVEEVETEVDRRGFVNNVGDVVVVAVVVVLVVGGDGLDLSVGASPSTPG